MRLSSVFIFGLSLQAVSDNAQNTHQMEIKKNNDLKNHRIGVYPRPASAPPQVAKKDTARYPGEKRYPYPRPSGPPPILLHKK